MNKRLTPREAAVSLTKGNHHSMTWEEATDVLLDNFVISDKRKDDDGGQADIRSRASNYTPLITDTFDPPKEQLETIIKHLKNGKGPGMDRLEAGILKAAWPAIGQLYHKLYVLYVACLATGTFPGNWKRGRLHAILKPGNKDLTAPGFYRPICLLPLPAKILESIILQKLTEHLDEVAANSDLLKHQHGFIRGRSTTDAIIRLNKIVNEATHKYVVGIFVDIKGAFDHIWWPDILWSLRTCNTPVYIYNIIHHYLTNREVAIQDNLGLKTRQQERGCPQGSVLGPILWNLVFYSLLIELNNANLQTIGYADDAVILISGNSRVALEDVGSSAISRVERWCSQHKMNLSADKTVGLMLKGNFNKERRPRIIIQGRAIKFHNGLDRSLLVKHLEFEDMHNSWLYCFTYPLEHIRLTMRKRNTCPKFKRISETI